MKGVCQICGARSHSHVIEMPDGEMIDACRLCADVIGKEVAQVKIHYPTQGEEE